MNSFVVLRSISCFRLNSSQVQQFRKCATSHGRTLRRPQTKSSIKEKLLGQATDTPFNIGKGVLAGASAIGLGALCFYGAGMSQEAGTIERANMWPEVVRQRVRDTYIYFGSSLAFTAASAVAISRSPVLMNLMSKNSIISMFATLGAVIGSGMIVRSIPYQPGFTAKTVAWMVHSSILGAVVAPLTILGGPIMIRAACYTAGIVGGLSALAVCAPSEKFLNMRGPLAMGLGAVFISSISSWFVPAGSALGAGLYSISLYGGLVVFSLFLLYDTQKIMKNAETHPTYGVVPYDPIDSCIGIYLDTLNIFIRIAIMLAGGGGNRRK